MREKKKEKIYILPGILGSVRKITKQLHERDGFDVEIVRFKYRKHSLMQLANILRRHIEPDYLNYNRIHFICYGVGGLILKEFFELAISDKFMYKVDRIIFVSSPIFGSKFLEKLNLFHNYIAPSNKGRFFKIIKQKDVLVISTLKKSWFDPLNWINSFILTNPKNNGIYEINETLGWFNTLTNVTLKLADRSHFLLPTGREVIEEISFFLNRTISFRKFGDGKIW